MRKIFPTSLLSHSWPRDIQKYRSCMGNVPAGKSIKPMKKIPLIVLASLLCGGGSALAANLMLDFGAAAVADPYLTRSPGHTLGAIPAGQTSWNTISSATPPSSLLYSDGTTASGVILGLGQESEGGNNTIDFSTSIGNIGLAGNGGGTAGQKNLLGVGSIYGDDNTTANTAAGRDGFFGGGTATGTGATAGAAIGMSLSGLAAGSYQVYVMARNTNSNIISNPKNIYSSVGAASGTFDFSLLTAMNQSNVGYASTVENPYSTFLNGENFVSFTFNITEGQTFYLAVDGASGIDNRGFLNMVQIVAVPEPASSLLGAAAGFLVVFRRRKC